MLLTMADQPVYYVSLGDSMSIDDYAGGAGCGAASQLFENDTLLFPEWRGRDLKTVVASSRLVKLAMDGATAATVRFAQLPRLKEFGVSVRYVTLTLGGNDLLQAWGNNEAAQVSFRAFQANARVVWETVRTLATPDARLAWATIYDPSDGTGDTGGTPLPPWGAYREWHDRFNAAIRAIAAEQGVVVAEVQERFLSHGRTAGDIGQSDPRPQNTDLWYCGYVEPNAYGAGAIRAAFWEALGF